MKPLCKAISISLLASLSLKALALPDHYDHNAQETQTNTKNTAKYLLNLGAWLGFNISSPPSTARNQSVSSRLLQTSNLEDAPKELLFSLLGAIPVDAVSAASALFVPQNLQGFSIFNGLVNYVFHKAPYNSDATQQGKITVNPLIDQQTYMADPVSQAVLNVLATPSNSFCAYNSGKSWDSTCKLLYQGQVTSNVIGTLPSSTQFFTYDSLQPVIGQLNSNGLIAPLMYDTSDPTSQTTSSSTSGQQSQDKGLQALNQGQTAHNFIRYVSGGASPIQLADHLIYDALYLQTISKTATEMAKISAQTTLTNYLTSLRSYSAKISVAVGNLYYIFSKRMPQQALSGNKQYSQALTEFSMATHRLYNSDMSANQQWITQINDASPATVQKEMAVLLAEINYQLYLNRQQQERILLTNSVMLLSNIQLNSPSLTTSP